METSAAAELKTLLVGVSLPAEREELVEYALRQHAEARFLGPLRQLPERSYSSLDEVIEELVEVQPDRGRGVPDEPSEESGPPPGGDDYTTPRPADTG